MNLVLTYWTITVNDPQKATEWFHSCTGWEWPYNFFTNNCSDYVRIGLGKGGTQASFANNICQPTQWTGAYTMSWSSGQNPSPLSKPIPGYIPWKKVDTPMNFNGINY